LYTAELGILGITQCSRDSTMKLGHHVGRYPSRRGNQWLMEPDETVRERRMRSSLIPLFMWKFIFAERLSVRRCISNPNEHRLKGGKIKHANGEEEREGTRS